MALRVNEDELLQFAKANEDVAGQVESDCMPDPELLSQMEAGFGPVGAEFTAAVGEFQSALQTSGTGVALRYTEHAGNIHAARRRYIDSDQSGAEGVSGSTSV